MTAVRQEGGTRKENGSTNPSILPGSPGLLEQLQAPAGRHRGITQLLTRVRSSPTPWGFCSGRRWWMRGQCGRGELSAALGTPGGALGCRVGARGPGWVWSCGGGRALGEGTGSGKEEEKGSRHAQKGCPSEGHCREQGWRRHACLTAPGPLQRPL